MVSTTRSASARQVLTSDETTPEPTVLQDGVYSPLEAFLSADLKNSDSVAKYFPLVEGAGAQKQVPVNVRGCSNVPLVVVEKIREFRRMDNEKQQQVVGEQSKLASSERKKLQSTVNDLCLLRRKILVGILTWEEANGLPPATDATRALSANASEETNLALATQALSLDSSGVSAPPLGTSTGNTTDTGASARVSTDNTTDTATDTAMETSDEENTNPNTHVGILSTEEERKLDAERRRKDARSDKKRKKSLLEPAKDILQTGGMRVRQTVHSSQMEAAAALDLMHLRDRFEGQPKTTLFQVYITEMKDPKLNGSHSTRSCTREKRLIQVVGNSHKEVVWGLNQVGDALLGKNLDTITFEPFYRDTTTQLVTTTVDAAIKNWKSARAGVSKTPLSSRESKDLFCSRRGY